MENVLIDWIEQIGIHTVVPIERNGQNEQIGEVQSCTIVPIEWNEQNEKIGEPLECRSNGMDRMNGQSYTIVPIIQNGQTEQIGEVQSYRSNGLDRLRMKRFQSVRFDRWKRLKKDPITFHSGRWCKINVISSIEPIVHSG